MRSEPAQLLVEPLVTTVEMVDLVDQGLGAIGEGNDAARLRLERMHEFYGFMGERLAVNLRDWAEQEADTRA